MYIIVHWILALNLQTSSMLRCNLLPYVVNDPVFSVWLILISKQFYFLHFLNVYNMSQNESKYTTLKLEGIWIMFVSPKKKWIEYNLQTDAHLKPVYLKEKSGMENRAVSRTNHGIKGNLTSSVIWNKLFQMHFISMKEGLKSRVLIAESLKMAI